jgi:CDP-diacylglycerol pyrophosphatase
MKRIAALAVAVLFAAGAVPAFAQQASQEKEENLIKIVSDTIKPGQVREKNKLRNPLPKVTVFQNAADGIKEGSAKAKQQTLRTR